MWVLVLVHMGVIEKFFYQRSEVFLKLGTISERDFAWTRLPA